MAPTMRAERFHADAKKIALEDVPDPRAGTQRGSGQSRLLRDIHPDLSLINGTFPAQAPS